MNDSKRFHVSLEDINAWNDVVARMPGILNLLDSLYTAVFVNPPNPPNPPTPPSGGDITTTGYFDIFSDGLIQIGTEGIPIDELEVGNTIIVGPFNRISAINGDSPNFPSLSTYFTTFRIGTIVLGDTTNVNPITSLYANGVQVTGPFNRVKVGNDIIYLTDPVSGPLLTTVNIDGLTIGNSTDAVDDIRVRDDDIGTDELIEGPFDNILSNGTPVLNP